VNAAYVDIPAYPEGAKALNRAFQMLTCLAASAIGLSAPTFRLVGLELRDRLGYAVERRGILATLQAELKADDEVVDTQRRAD
jgi:hypothetical protein